MLTSAVVPARRVPVVLLILAALASALLFAGTNRAVAAPTHRASSPQSIAKAVLTMLNKERAANKLPALTMDTHLIKSAHAHNLVMAKDNELSHQLPREAALGTRETRAGYRWTWAGENIGWNSQMNQAGVLQLEQMMYDEVPPNDGHRLNILSTHFKNIGVDVYMDNTNHKVWLTQDFGRH